MTIAIAVRTHNMSSHRTETTSAPVAFVVWQIATTLRVHTGLQGGKPHVIAQVMSLANLSSIRLRG